MSSTPSGLPTITAVTRPRKGFTLTELLVAAVLSLIVMGAIASLFAILGRTVRNTQTTVELGARMRTAAWQLRQDLAGLTCRVSPWLSPEENAGYFELIEGPAHDTTFALVSGSPTANLCADSDDVLLFTTQSLAGPFVGRSGAIAIESPYAEVAWFCRPSASQPVAGTTLHDLHRRQLLVMAYLGQASQSQNTLAPSVDRNAYDLSLRAVTVSGGTTLIPNSLGDLTKRENRFLRSGTTAFPHRFPVDTSSGVYAIQEAGFDSTPREWEDVILTNVIGFDVRVFDPDAPIPAPVGLVTRHPGEPGYEAPLAPDSKGAYVDLGYGGGTPLVLSGTQNVSSFPPPGQTALQSAGAYVAYSSASNFVTLSPPSVPTSSPSHHYDTWSRHYESDGVDQDRDGTVDEGTVGKDMNGDGVPEDVADRETSPPYPVALRGIEIRIRCYEPTSKQVRQTTVRHAFSK